MSALPILPTSVVGSHGKPGWWFTAVKAWEAEEMGPGDMEEMFDDAVHTAIRDMESAGIDIITDGEVRRTDGYVDTYYRIIKNIAPLPVRRKAGPWGYDQQQRYEAVGRIELERLAGDAVGVRRHRAQVESLRGRPWGGEVHAVPVHLSRGRQPAQHELPVECAGRERRGEQQGERDPEPA